MEYTKKGPSSAHDAARYRLFIFTWPKRQFSKRSILTVLGFFALWQRNHQARPKTQPPSEKHPCTFLKQKKFCVCTSSSLFPSSVPYLLCPSPCSLRQRPKTTNKIMKSQACAKTAFFKEDVFDLDFPNPTSFSSFWLFWCDRFEKPTLCLLTFSIVFRSCAN